MRRTVALCVAILAAGACRRAEPAAPRAAPEAPAPEATPQSGYLDGARDGPPVAGGTLRRRLPGEPTTLNAVLQSSAPEAQVLQYLQRNLLDFDAGMNLVPSLAESVAASADGREYTVTLRDGALWEDGRPVTSRDAVFTIGKITDPSVPALIFKPLFEDLERIEELDARRFRLRFRDPYAWRQMAFVVPLLPAHRFAAGGAFAASPENRAPLSNGPYRLVSWKTGESIELERNPGAFGPRGTFDRVVFKILPDNTTAYRLMTAGGLDEFQMDASQKARSVSDAAFEACCRRLEFYNLDFNYIALNNRSPLFSDARVRRALTMLLDRASIVRGLYRGSARVISGPWAPDSPAYDGSLPPLPFDPAEASRLLTEAGWVDADGDGVRERDGKRFAFELLVSAGSDIGRQIDEMLAAEAARVGVTARVRAMEWAAFVERVDAGDFEAASLGWSAVDPNPDPYFYWSSTQCPPAGLNAGCYRNPEADRLMVEARRELDPARRAALFHRLHRIFRDDAPAIFVVNATQKVGLARRIRGVTTSPLGLFGIWPGPVGWWDGSAAGTMPAPRAAATRPAA